MWVTPGKGTLGSFASTQLSGSLAVSLFLLTALSQFPGICSPQLFVRCLYCFLFLPQSSLCEARRTTPALQSADAQFIFHRKKNVSLFLFECLWQPLGVGRNLCLSKQKQRIVGPLEALLWPTLF